MTSNIETQRDSAKKKRRFESFAWLQVNGNDKEGKFIELVDDKGTKCCVMGFSPELANLHGQRVRLHIEPIEQTLQ